MSGHKYSEEFKIQAVRQIVGWGYSVAKVASQLGVSTNSLYAWKNKYAKHAKTPLISLSEYQNSLLEGGVAVSAYCTHEGYGEIIFNQVIANPSCDLHTTMRTKMLEALSGDFQYENKEMQEIYELADDAYLERLEEDFEFEQRTGDPHKNPRLEWIDSGDRRNGVMASITHLSFEYFQLKVNPYVYIAMQEAILSLDVGTAIKEVLQAGIEGLCEYYEIDADAAFDIKATDWPHMLTLEDLVYRHCRFPKKLRKELDDSVLPQLHECFGVAADNLFAPVTNNYKHQIRYEAAADTGYFSIGRSVFFLVIAGERSDGAHEVTIFNAVNEI